jgi:hypothetical protein
MLTFSAVLVLGVFAQQLGAHGLQVTNSAHAPVTLTSVVHLHEIFDRACIS